MIVIPAIDIKAGRCVRLLQGQMDKETVFSDDPASMARRWVDEGARRIHVVDLDGAIEKTPKNLKPIEQIVAAAGSVPIQVGGGIRDMETLRMYLDLGVDRVVIGSVAIYDPALVKQASHDFPGRIVVGIDARDGRVAIEGWTQTTGVSAIDLGRQFEDCGVAAINFTDIERDGMQTGPNITAIREFARAIRIPVVASGGVSCMEDIRRLSELAVDGVAGIITGRALYDGRLNLGEAVAFLETL
jgi:phosphoribosylformimino-5-aminoimidazole carboxamide ribotide isomerase